MVGDSEALDLSYLLLQPEALPIQIRPSREEHHERLGLHCHQPWCHYLGNFIVVISPGLAFAVGDPLKLLYYWCCLQYLSKHPKEPNQTLI